MFKNDFSQPNARKFEDARHKKHVLNLLTVLNFDINEIYVIYSCSSIANFKTSDVIEKWKADFCSFAQRD